MTLPTTKYCPKCCETKPTENFGTNSGRYDGLQGWCKVCHSLSRQRWRDVNKDKVKELSRKNHLKRYYGITVDDFEALWAAHEGRCGICSNALSLDDRGTTIDHNHNTDEIRGLLCQHCNRGLGSFRDNPALLEVAAGYLREKGHYGPQVAQGASAPA